MLNFTVKWEFLDVSSQESSCHIFNWTGHRYSDTCTIDLLIFLPELHRLGLEMATPSSSACGTVNPGQTPVLSAPTWRVLFPASSWKSAMRTFCSTSCPLTPAVWLVSLTCWPTTTRSWASPTSLFHRPPSTRWGGGGQLWVIQLCLKGFCTDPKCNSIFLTWFIFVGVCQFCKGADRWRPPHRRGGQQRKLAVQRASRGNRSE